MNASNGWHRYLQLIKERPEDFMRSPNDLYTLQTDENVVKEFERKTGSKIGVSYESKYNILVVDLLRAADGSLFSFERIIPAIGGGAVVCLVRRAEKFVLIRQYRHAIGREQIAFVRGYGEKGISAVENARKEVREELGAEARFITHLGKVTPDSGFCGQTVDVFDCEVDDMVLKPGYEGITSICEYSRDELVMAIDRGEIDDSFSLSAIALVLSRSNSAY